jgi:hypothetical protein
MDADFELVVNYTGGQCRARIAMPQSDEPQPDLGQQICREIVP